MGSTADLTSVIRQLPAPPGAAAGDAELLARYARDRDPAAFAALVRRHGPLVLGVARRQLADRHRAEDVFQATFLALARSAAKLDDRPSVTNWLYTVALRQARKARAGAARRAAVEAAAPPPSPGGDPLGRVTARELLQALDDELARLPDRLRLPVLLCLVQGLSREEAAGRLGCSPGSVKGLLERGRKKLAARLAARGLAPCVGLALATVPPDLLARTAELAADPWSRAVPAPVAALAAAVRPRALLPAAALAGVALSAVTAWALASGAPTPAEPPAAPARIAASAQPAPGEPLPDGAAKRFGTPWFRHPTAVESLAASADGVFAVAVSGGRMDSVTRAYDLATGRPRFSIADEPGARFAEGVAVSPDGQTVAVKRAEAVCLHAAATGKEFARILAPAANPRTTTDLLTFSPDGKLIAVASGDGKAVLVLDVAKGEVACTLPHAEVVFAGAFAPDGKQLVAGGYDREKNAYFARVWEVGAEKELRRLAFGGGGIRSVAYSPDGKTVAIGGDGGKTLEVKLFDAATGKEVRAIPFPGASSVKSVAFSPDGKTLAASGGAATRLFDAATGREVLKISGKAVGLRFTPDGKVLVGAVASTVYRWEVATGKPLIPEGGDSPVAQVELVGGGSRLVTRGQDGDAHVWDAKTGARLRRIDVTWQRGLAVGPDGRHLVWPREDETVKFKDPDQPNATYTGSRLRMLDLDTGKEVERFGGFEGDAHALFFTSGGKALLTVDFRDGGVRVWDVASGKAERSFRVSETAGPYQVWRAVLSPDGKVLAATYQRGGRGLFGGCAVKLWDVATGKELRSLPGHYDYVEAVAFARDGKHLVTGCPPLSKFAQERLKLPADQVFVWEVATGKRVASLPVGATAAAFGVEGKTLAVAAPGGALQFWDVEGWKLRAEFPGPRDRVTALTFGPDGRLYSGSMDATVLAWDPKTAR